MQNDRLPRIVGNYSHWNSGTRNNDRIRGISLPHHEALTRWTWGWAVVWYAVPNDSLVRWYSQPGDHQWCVVLPFLSPWFSLSLRPSLGEH